MKKAKLTLGLVTAAIAVAGMAACNVTAKEGYVLSFTDATGNTYGYTASELFDHYQDNSGAVNTDFDKVYEVLVRKYYAGKTTELEELKVLAQEDVNKVREQAETNAANNGTSYAVEIEALLTSNGVDNIAELADKKLYEEEKSRFESSFYDNNLEGMKTGTTFTTGNDKGYLKDRLPYHVRHVLVKVDAANGEHTQATISAENAKKLANVVENLAGDNHNHESAGANRMSFGQIANKYSDDSGSASNYGDLGIMDRETGYVPEFKLGLYAYEALYSGRTASEDTARLLPSEDLTMNLSDAKVKDFFANFNDGSGTGLGTIPYGAAVAIGDSSDVNFADLDYSINGGSSVYYPRNVLFNKYFNKHNVCVITPNDIEYAGAAVTNPTASGSILSGDENFVGVENPTYAALPGFKEVNGKKVLTDNLGNVILVARAGTSDYQGIHFITIARSALDEYVKYENGRPTVVANYDEKDSADVTSLADYYTMKYPAQGLGGTGYPAYTAAGSLVEKTTFVNTTSSSSDYQSRATTVANNVKGYNTNVNTYIFEWLVQQNSITYANTAIKERIDNYINAKREYTTWSNQESFDANWKSYAESLAQQQVKRESKNGLGSLVSETCSIMIKAAIDGDTTIQDMIKNKTGVFGEGGACYAK